MKKRNVLVVLLSAVMALSTAGCSHFFVGDIDSGKPSVEMIPTEGDTEPTHLQNSAGSDAEVVTDESLVSADYVELNYNDTMLYIMDTDGNLMEQYDLEQIEEEFADKGFYLKGSDFKRYAEGVLYYHARIYNEDYSSTDAVYAVDPKRGEAKEIYRSELGIYIYDLDVYKGKLYFQTTKEGRNVYTGHCYGIGPDFTFEEETELEHAGYFAATEEYDVTQSLNKTFDGRCPARIFDEVGFIVGEKDEALYKLDKDGNAELIYTPDGGNHTSIFFYDKNKVIFSLSDAEYDHLGKYVLDIESGKADLISDTESLYQMAFANGVFYYTTAEEVEFGVTEQKLIAYDTETGGSRVILEGRSIPGTGAAADIYTFSSAAGSNLFVPVFDDGAYVWNLIDTTADTIAPKSLGLVANRFSVFDYGKVEYVTSSWNCLDCGTPLSKYYGEKFILDPKYSDHADEINKEIADYIDGSANIAANDSMYSDSTCEEHQDDPTLCQEDEDRVLAVNIFEDKYLTVELSGYWYTGGAHGYPSRAQFLFDLTTGQRYGIKDFYKGTEEEFKALVAEKVKEDFNRENKDYYYFAGTEDEAYDSAYESAALDDRAEFTADGIDFLFYPYDLGPYASGFITIHISYEELLGRSTLSE
jgi:hypothetical protein